MRLGILAFLAALCLAAPVAAQTSITLDANPVALIDAEINGRAVRLEVDPRFPDLIAMSTTAAERLGVRRIPFAQARFIIDGGESMNGRIARPNIAFDQRRVRNVAVIFPAPVSTRADGVIGPGSLPYDIVTLRLREDGPAMRDIVLALDDADHWYPTVGVGGHALRIRFDVANESSIFNGAASRLFDPTGAIPSAGEIAMRPVILGLSTRMQPVRVEGLTLEGLPLGPTYARTGEPLLGALEEDALVVQAEADGTPPSLTLGRAALDQGGCASISVNRRTRQLTLRCAA
jgi:hypothetical protein